MADDVMNRRLIQEVTDKWWLVLLRGLATVFLGIFLIINTQITLTIIIFIFGVYWLIMGTIELFRVVVGWKKVAHHLLLLVSTVLQIGVGLIIVIWPLVSATFLTSFMVYVIAFVALCAGIIAIVRGVYLRQYIDNEWTLIIGGVIAILYGLLVLFNPSFPSIHILAIVLGGISIVGGFLVILFSFRLRNIGKRLEAS